MTMKKAKIAVLVSGGGTNLQALLDAPNMKSDEDKYQHSKILQHHIFP